MKIKKIAAGSLIFLIILLAGVLRLYKISSVPPSLSWDEASIGYDALSIAQTGKDQWGFSFPLAFKSFGEYKYPFHIYTTALFVKLLGLNELSVRLGSALLGIFNVFLLYLFVKVLTKNKTLALLSSLLLAVSPWNIQFSRVSWETNYTLLFFLSGLILFFKGLSRKKILPIIFSYLLFGLSLFTYNAAKVFIPPFLLGLNLIYFKDIRKIGYKMIIPFAIFIALLCLNIFNTNLSGLNRYNQLGFETDRVVATYAYKVSHIYKLGWIEVAFKQYLAHFSPKFLFVSGDPNPRHSTQGVGEMLVFDILFLPFGLITLLSQLKKDDKKIWLLLFWFLLWPLPASIAREYPHASRAMFGLGILPIISAFGIVKIVSVMPKKILPLVYLFGLMLFVVPIYLYLNVYFTKYPSKYSQYWQYGYKEAANLIKSRYSDYDRVYFTRAYGEPQIFMLFYLHYPPRQYQTGSDVVREKVGDWIKVAAFDKFVFLDKDEFVLKYREVIKRRGQGKSLFVGLPGDFTNSAEKLKTINFLDGSEAFEIVETI